MTYSYYDRLVKVMRKDDPRIIGTFDERILLLTWTNKVYQLLPKLHCDLSFDQEAFAHITGGFLREKTNRKQLMGHSSFSNPNRGHTVQHQSRHGIYRILIDRKLLSQNPEECVKTIHHEFVHALLKNFKSSHGEQFWEHEARINGHISRIINEATSRDVL